ncbi:unnamed protein product [Rotaria sp. Silwood1]|nr:unnamed protein product [Rotaria sp. Silwood1]
MEVSILKEKKQVDSIENMFKETNQQYNNNIDYKCLLKYNHYNKHFSIINIIFNKDEQEKDKIVGYDCIYQYENIHIKIEHYLSNQTWKINNQQSNYEKYQNLNILLEDLNYSRYVYLDQQIQIIIKRFDNYFHVKSIYSYLYLELNQTEQNQHNHNKTSTFFILKQDDNDQSENNNHNQSNELSINNNISIESTILQVDQSLTHLDLPIQTSLSHSNKISKNLKEPNQLYHIHQDSSSSSINSVKYTKLVLFYNILSHFTIHRFMI